MQNIFKKYKIIGLFSVLFILYTKGYSQSYKEDKYIDSLYEMLNKQESKDTTYINLLSEIGEAQPIFRISYWDSIVNFSEIALKKVTHDIEKVSLKKSIAGALNNIGFIYNNLGQIEKSLEFYNIALKIREKIGDELGIASSLNNIGSIYDSQGAYEIALSYYFKSLKIQQSIDNKDGIGNCLNNIGYIYSLQSDYEKALEYYEQA
jgi:tetratricopeptide (TPR) repeat protein